MKKSAKPLFLKGTLLTLLFIFAFSALPLKPVFAQAATDLIGGPVTVVMKVISGVTRKLDAALSRVGSTMVQTAITNSLKRVAYDTASWIGSGGEGQKPLYVTETPSKYLLSIADSAAGDYIDAFASNLNVNFCQPNLNAKILIGLGLVDGANDAKIKDSTCKASTMVNSWKTSVDAKIKDINSPDFLKNMAGMFSVGGSDLSVALDVMSGLDKKVLDTKEQKKLDLSIEGWLPRENIGGQTTEPPGTAKAQMTAALQATADSQKVSIGPHPITDASKVFLNTLAVTAFNKALRNLSQGNVVEALTLGLYKGKTDKEIADSFANGGVRETKYDCLNDPNCDPSVYHGSSAVTANLAKMIKPTFESRGDYDILSELSVCPDSTKPGPTNCILDGQFSSAISEHKTVIEAIKEGFLNKNWKLTREVDFNQGYSLRSLLVLRKFRIIPVGWETALIKTEENNSKATLMDLVSCFDPNDSYNEFSQGFVSSTWCQGLIDPNWVLKAPLNYCKREGYGNQILDKTIISASENIPSEVILTRADNYCADEQSCIKEKADGTCEAYGYCTEEKRTWDFASDSCDAIYNTCQTFVKSNGAGVAYLENTIDYSTCNADNVGCRPYAMSGAYTTSTDKIAWNNLKSIYFSKKAALCDSSQEGCNELIRINMDAGHNFLLNSDFEQSLEVGSWNINTDINNLSSPNSATTTADGYFSYNSLILNGAIKKNVAVGPNDYNISGRTYTFSFYAKNCDVSDQAVLGGVGVDDKTINLNSGSDWNYYSLTYGFPLGLSDNHVYISVGNSGGDNSSCQIDRAKLELAKLGTAYSDYYQNGLTYQKLIPSYLASACYISTNPDSPDYRLKPGAPAKCYNYTRRCNASEVDCDLYTSVRDEFILPAKATPFDACFAECDGYDSYIQKATSFQNSLAANFIPKTAGSCSADVVGCTEFTNLDAVSQGGEGKEYYSFLRQCIKPNNNICGVFYSWGSAGSGYQLQPYKLKAVGDQPVLTEGSFDAGHNQLVDGALVCDEAIYNASPSDSTYNADCRQLYNKDGVIFYALYSNTITCSEDCHPYRISESPIDESITDPANCDSANTYWDEANSLCYVCKNGGVWDTNQNACVYQAIPGEGKSCAASENGCREYNGNYGNNLKIVDAYDFENNQAWVGNCNDNSSLSTDSINKNGHSLSYNFVGGNCADSASNFDPNNTSRGGQGFNLLAVARNLWSKVVPDVNAAQQANYARGVGITVGTSVKQNSAYVLRFLAKTNNDVFVNAYLSSGYANSAFNVNSQNNSGVVISGGNEWRMYSLNLTSLDHAVAEKEALIFSADGSFLLDNVVLTEVTDRFYLIKDSWLTPNSCYYDVLDQYQGVNYNLGCSAYTNRTKQVSYLRNFSHLCTDSSAGCELMFLTNNSADPGVQAFRESGTPNNHCDSGDGADCVEVSADQMAYVVYDDTKQCGAENKGCTRLGAQSATNQDVSVQNLYTDTYVNNNPDKYESTLCGGAEVGCDVWKYLDGQSSYFKDPGDNVCEWRQPVGVSGLNLAKKWYKRAIKRCDFDGNGKINVDIHNNITEAQNKLCSADTDCSTGHCILDQNNYLCTVDSLKTIGLGGGNLVYQPQDTIGVCETKASGCTEYIDPVSEFSPNIVVNPTWEDINKDRIPGDVWATSTLPSAYPNYQKQSISLLKNKLYSFSATDMAASYNTVLVCPASVRVLTADNSFAATTDVITIDKTVTNKNILFNSLNNVSCTVYGAETNKTINIRGTVLDYKLLTDVDKTACKGAVGFDTGCILFNERKQSGAGGLSAMSWSAYGGSYNSGSPVTPANLSEADSNVLIKVKPNRICSSWLACVSGSIDPVTGEETCNLLGECDNLSDYGRCQSFVTKSEINHTFNSGNDRNISGYSKMNNYYLSGMSETGEDTRLSWEFNDDLASISGSYSIVTSSEKLGSKSNISYPAEGIGVLKVTNAYPDNVAYITAPYPFKKGTKYYINFLINIDDSGGKGGTLKLHFNGTERPGSYTSTGSGWQRKVLEFSPIDDSDSVVIYLYSGVHDLAADDAPIYFDDISIEPVLKVANDTYVAKECRLYPKQDSLSCKSSNANVISDGIYGYCLEHDPKNPDVCLMWYPIDNVRSSQASSGANSGFNGYSPSGPTPSYCARVSANFIFVELRTGYDLKGPYHINGECGGNNECYIQNGFGGDCSAGYERKGVFCDCQSSGTCGVRRTHWHKNICAPTAIPLSQVGPTKTIEDKCYGNESGSATKRYQEGWYEYDGSLVQGEVLKIVNLDITDSTACSAAGGEYFGTFNRHGNGCLMDVSEYQPKCIEFLNTTGVPWVGRLKNIASSGTVSFWEPANNNQAFGSGPFKNYNNTRGANDPYGPALAPVPANLGAGSAGVPYGCDNNTREYFMDGSSSKISTCRAIVANDNSFNSFSVTTANVAGIKNLGLDSTNNDPARVLKNIFLKFTWGSSSYDYSGPNFKNPNPSAAIPTCATRYETGHPDANWCAILPKINNVKMMDPEKQVITPDASGAYHITSAGYYTLHVGTSIDAEQAPIYQLVVDFDDGFRDIRQSLDSSSDFPFVHYYNPSNAGTDYHIRIKVADNWGFYSCQGLSGNCVYPDRCCLENFNPLYDYNEEACEGCLD